MAEECIFCKIIKGEIPSSRVYEDKDVLAFLDINPVHPGHTLVIPKNHCINLLDMPEEDIGKVYSAAKKVASAVKKAVNAGGITVSMSNEAVAGQVVFHAHVHVIPRFEKDGLKLWPGRKYKAGQSEEVHKRILEAMK